MIVLHVASCLDVVSEIWNKQNDQSNQLVVDEMPLFVFFFFWYLQKGTSVYQVSLIKMNLFFNGTSIQAVFKGLPVCGTSNTI